MSSTLTLKVGNVTAAISLNGASGQTTDMQVGAALTRYAESLAIPLEGSTQENLTAILEHIRDEVKRRAKIAQWAALRAADDAAHRATVESDNDL